MVLEEIEKSLPNGLHDAEISDIFIDYVNRVVTLNLEIWTGDLTSKSVEVRESYQSATLTIYDFLYLAIEPPDGSYPYYEKGTISVGTGSLQADKIPSAENLPKLMPEGAFGHWFFVNNWNSFIFIAAMKAGLKFNK